MMRAVARNLSGPALKVWLELGTRYYCGKKCDVYLSLDEATRLLGIGKSTARKAFKELEAYGFIVMVEEGSWYWSRATRWRFTEKPYDGQPTNDWKRLCGQKQAPGTEAARKEGENVRCEYRDNEIRAP